MSFSKYVILVFNYTYEFFNVQKFLNFELKVSVFSFIVSHV